MRDMRCNIAGVQIITRAKTPDNEVAGGSVVKEGYPHQAGSAPSMPHDVSTELPGCSSCFVYSPKICTM